MPIWDELGLSKWTIAFCEDQASPIPLVQGSRLMLDNGERQRQATPPPSSGSPHPVFFLASLLKCRATGRQGAPEGRIGSAARAKLIQGLTVRSVLTPSAGSAPGRLRFRSKNAPRMMT